MSRLKICWFQAATLERLSVNEPTHSNLDISQKRLREDPDSQPRRVACRFFDPDLAKNFKFSLPRLNGASGSATYILSRPHSTQKHILKELPRNISLEKIAWTQKFSHWLRTSGYAVTPIATSCRVNGRRPQCFSPMIASDCDGTYWQCIEFMEGSPRKTPTTQDVHVAVKAVAALHCQAKSFTTPRPQGLTGWQRRVRQLSSIMLSPRVLPKKSNRPEPSNAEVRALCEQFDKVLRSPDVVRALTRMIAHRMPTMQVPVLQDCWWGHIFFSKTQQRITGIIDLDSASRDDPAVDMARLLGSWQIENALCSEKLIDLWPEAFEIYKQTYRCNPDFSRRVQRLHDTAIVCGLDRWFSWILIENRQFLNMPWVMERIRRLFLATPHALRRLGAH